MQNFKIKNSLIIVVFGILLLSVVPTIFTNSLTKIQLTLAQSEAMPSNDTR